MKAEDQSEQSNLQATIHLLHDCPGFSVLEISLSS
jgi:hypothetical protein